MTTIVLVGVNVIAFLSLHIATAVFEASQQHYLECKEEEEHMLHTHD